MRFLGLFHVKPGMEEARRGEGQRDELAWGAVLCPARAITNVFQKCLHFLLDFIGVEKCRLFNCSQLVLE